MNAILKEEPPQLPGVPPALERVVWRCMEKSPDERFQSARDLGFALQALSEVSAPARKPRRPALGRKRLAWAVALLALLAILAAGMALLLRDRRKRLSTGAPASKNAEANEYFERAMLFLRMQNKMPEGRQMLERALQLDPHFAEARRWYGFSHALMIDGGHSNDTTWLYRAEEELRQALRDGPNLATVHSALAAVYLHQGRKELVPIEVEKCLKVKRDDPEALSWLEEYHRMNGENAAAMALARRMIEREPLFFPARMQLGETLRGQGDTAGAIREQEKVLEQAPENLYGIWFLSRAYLDAGELAKARAILERGRSIDHRNYAVRIEWALLLALEGKREEALQAMDEEVLKSAGTNFMSTLVAAEFFAVMGDASKSLEWLERAVRNGDDRAEWFQRDPLLANIRQEPRFQQIVASIAYRRKR
jgi:tetratricopeptide (TPR) repeat protein